MKLMNSRFLPVIFYLILNSILLVERLSMAIGAVPHSNETHSHLQIFQIMLVVPTTVHFDGYCKYQLPKWERGEEILPGAHIAVSEINGSPEILRDFQLEIVAIKVPMCSASAAINAFVGNLTSRTKNNVAIIGYFCDNLAHTFSRLVGRSRFEVIQISAMPPFFSWSNHNIDIPYFHYILPSIDVYAKATVMLVKTLGWRQIGIISNGWYHDVHFSRIKEAFTSEAQEHGITTVLHEESNPANSMNKILRDLKNSYAKVIVAFLPPSEAVEIVCKAHLQGFNWPNYVWLFVEISSDEMIKMTNKCSETTMIMAMENVIFLDLHLKQYKAKDILSSGVSYSTFVETYHLKLETSTNIDCLQSNPYASVLYDIIWTLAIAMNTSMNRSLNHSRTIIEKELRQFTFQGASGLLNYTKPGAALNLSLGIFQVQNGDAVLIGLFNSYRQQILLNRSALKEIPSDELDRVYILYPRYLTGILCICFIFMMLFTTVTMSLFVCYRNHPEIKATSSVLSLCMFAGCYLLIVSTLNHTIASGVVIDGTVLRFLSCWGNDFLNTVGLDLVLATVFAKTLRIHYIFNKFGKISSQLWSDKGLLGLILAIMSVKGVIMVLWIVVDTNYLIDEVRIPLQGFPPHQVVVQKCYSRYPIVWIALTFGYSGILGLFMMIVAILTKNVKRERFKDSKKICTLVAVLFLSYCAGCVLWFFLRETGAYIGSKVFSDLAFYAVPFVCQIFLFLPKIIPLLIYNKEWIKTKTTSTSSRL